MTMKLNWTKQPERRQIRFRQVKGGDCFTLGKDQRSPIYQRLAASTGHHNCTTLLSGWPIKFEDDLVVHLVLVDAVCRWADE
jgi:hypothetical protein